MKMFFLNLRKNNLLSLQRNFPFASHCQYYGQIVPFVLADIGEGITEVQILNWHVKEGDPVKEFDKVAEVQSDKAAVELTSRYEGKVRKLYGEIGDIIKVGNPLMDIETMDAVVFEKSTKKFTEKPEVKRDADRITRKVLATPALRGIAKDSGILLDQLPKGSGKDGRIILQDLPLHFNGDSISPAASKKETPKEENAFEMKPLSMIQKSMLKNMQQSMTIPHFGYSEKINMDNLIRLKNEFKEDLKAKNISTKLSFLSFIIKLTAVALKEFPILNSQLLAVASGEGGGPSDLDWFVKTFRDIHIGIAMDTPQGLIVPSIKYVSRKSILEISFELDALIEKGTKGQLTRDDLSGSTFTLSNIGSIGTGVSAFPIIPSPQVCIGALSRIHRVVVAVQTDKSDENFSRKYEGNFNNHDFERKYIRGLQENEHLAVIAEMTVDWSADHRFIDGATMAKFSKYWKFLLENPQFLLLVNN